MKPEIIKIGSILTIKTFVCRKGTAPELVVDLVSNAGEFVRIWLDEDMTYSTNKHKDHYWQVAELQVLTQKYRNIDTGKVDEQGLPITTSEPIPIEIGAVRLFDIEEVA